MWNRKIQVEIQIENTIISSVKRVKLLGVHIDGRLDFGYHVNQICKKAGKKIHALSKVCKYMDQNKKRMLMKAFIISQFSYCPLVWIFHSRNTKKNGVSTGLTDDISHFVNKPHDLRNNRILFRKRNRTVFYGTKILSSLAPRIWELIPQSLKDETELSQFKTKIKTWTTSQCPCRLCKKYIGHVGFI